MSYYHVLETSEKGHKSEVVYHIAIPNENNGIGVNLRTALAQKIAYDLASEGLTFRSAVPWLPTGSGSESEQIENGEIYEHSETVRYDGGLNFIGKRTIMDDRYTALAATIPDRIRARLLFWGFDRDV